MENIVKKYSWNHTVYLLPILKDNGVDERRQYKNAITLMNRRLKVPHCMRHCAMQTRLVQTDLHSRRIR